MIDADIVSMVVFDADGRDACTTLALEVKL